MIVSDILDEGHRFVTRQSLMGLLDGSVEWYLLLKNVLDISRDDSNHLTMSTQLDAKSIHDVLGFYSVFRE